jgi:dipeptide/tripeptide permease
MLFYEKAVDRHVMGTTIPSSAFLSFDPLFVLLCSPILLFLSSRYIEKTKPVNGFVKTGCGFLCVAASFGILALSTWQANSPLVPLSWIIAAFFVQTIGELWIAPISFSKISQYAPLRYKSILMSFWPMSIAYGHYLAGFVARFSLGNKINQPYRNSAEQYHPFFLRLALLALCVGLSLLLYQAIQYYICKSVTLKKVSGFFLSINKQKK